MDPPEMIMVDCKTFEELVQALGELVDYSRWVIARQDVEASHKLRPIVKRMIYLLVVITEGKVPEAGTVIEILDRVDDEVEGHLAHAKSPEEEAALLHEYGRFLDTVQELMQKHSGNKKGL